MMEAKIKAVPNRISEKAKAAVPDLLSMALWFIVSFASAEALLFGKIMPFGISSVAAAKRKDCFAAALGAITGYVFSGSTESKLRYLAAVIAVFGAKLAFERLMTGDLAAVLIAGGGMAVTCFGYAAVSTISGYGAVMALSETVISAGAAYFFRRTGSAFDEGKIFSSLSSGDKACIIVTAAIVSASLMPVTFGRISLGEIAACFVVLMAARYVGVSGGSIAGIATGIAVALSSANMDGVLSGYAVGGLMSGMFSPFGKICSGTVFAVVKLMFCFISAGEYMELSPFYESVVAFTVFLLVPEKWSRAFAGAALYDERTANSATVKELVLSRMGQAASALNDISETTKKVLESVEHESTTDMSTILNGAAGKYCTFCQKSGDCWKEHRSNTVKEFYEIGNAARKSKDAELTEDFRKQCGRINEIDGEVKARYKEAARKNSEERKIKNVRGVVTDQFDGLALLLRDIAGEAASIKSTDKKLSAAVKGAFEERNIPVFAAVCYYSVDDCINVEVSAAKDRIKNIDIRGITEELSDICGCDFSLPSKRETENAVRMFFSEKPLIEAEFGEISINAAGEKFCGDSSERFIDQNGHANMILSDGMGSGDYAALDSMMTAGLTAKLVKAGFRFGAAIKLVNSALLLKSENESLATVDAFSMNLYTGRADFYKSGAAPSFIMKNGKASKIESVSMPIGILGGAEYEQNSVILGAGDIALLVSDGVTATGEDWIMSEMRYLSGKTAKEMAKSIAETAYKRRNDGHSDDITVMAMKLKKTE